MLLPKEGSVSYGKHRVVGYLFGARPSLTPPHLHVESRDGRGPYDHPQDSGVGGSSGLSVGRDRCCPTGRVRRLRYRALGPEFLPTRPHRDSSSLSAGCGTDTGRVRSSKDGRVGHDPCPAVLQCVPTSPWSSEDTTVGVYECGQTFGKTSATSPDLRSDRDLVSSRDGADSCPFG